VKDETPDDDDDDDAASRNKRIDVPTIEGVIDAAAVLIVCE